MGDSKNCQNPECQRPLKQKPREGKYNYQKRKTCNRHCSNKSRMLNHNIQLVKFGTVKKRRKFSTSTYTLSKASRECISHECGYIIEESQRCPWYAGTSDTSQIWRTRGMCPFYKWSIEDGQANTRE